MKTSAVGIVSAAILMVVVGVGFGIAQAGGPHSEQPVLSFEDMEALQRGISSSSYVETRPVMSFEDQEATQVANSSEEFVPEGNWAGTDWQARGAIEAAGLPVGNHSDPSIVEIDGVSYYRLEGKLYGPF